MVAKSKPAQGLKGLGIGALYVLSAYGLSKILIAGVGMGAYLNPKTLMLLSVPAALLIYAYLFMLPLKGWLFRGYAARPSVSIHEDHIGLVPTSHSFIVQTRYGYRAFFSLDLPIAESSAPTSNERTLRRLLETPKLEVVYYEKVGPAAELAIDQGIEPGLLETQTAIADYYRKKATRGPITMQIMVEVESVQDGVDLLHETDSLKPLPYEDYLSGFFRNKAIGETGMLAEPSAKGIPATVTLDAGTFVPLGVADYREGYQLPKDHARFQQIRAGLNRDVLVQIRIFPITRSEINRSSRMAEVVNFWPFKALLEQRKGTQLAGQNVQISRLRDAWMGPTPPHLLHQVIWIKLEPGDQAGSMAHKAKGLLWEMGLQVGGYMPLRASKQFCSLFPGLEDTGIDTKQGLGLKLTEEAILAELSPTNHWLGHPEPMIYLSDETGRMVPFSLFGGGNNHNGLGAGESGSGKSFLLNGLFTGLLGQSPLNRVFVVDYGGSFSTMARELKAPYICFGDDFQFPPLPRLQKPMAEAEFLELFPGQKYGSYLGRVQFLNGELKNQALSFVLDHLLEGRVEVKRSANFEKVFFEFMDVYNEQEGPLDPIFQEIKVAIQKKMAAERDEKILEAYQDLGNVLSELRALVSFTPYLGEGGGLSFGLERFTAINLEGFGRRDQQILMGLITLQISSLFAKKTVGRTLIVFDEIHELIRRTPALAGLLESLQRVTRKYGASLLMATQSPMDFAPWPSLLENASNHFLMRIQGQIPPELKIQNDEILAEAREAEPAFLAGFSLMALGMSTPLGNIETCLQYRVAPVVHLVFTSNKIHKLFLSMLVLLAGKQNVLELAQALEDIAEDGEFGVVGSKTFMEYAGGLIRPEYQTIRKNWAAWAANLEGSQLLHAFAGLSQEEFLIICQDEARVLGYGKGNHDPNT